MGTRDTAAWVRGVSRCAKNLDRTCTRGTRFGSTVGLTVPVLNANDGHECPDVVEACQKFLAQMKDYER